MLLFLSVDASARPFCLDFLRLGYKEISVFHRIEKEKHISLLMWMLIFNVIGYDFYQFI